MNRQPLFYLLPSRGRVLRAIFTALVLWLHLGAGWLASAHPHGFIRNAGQWATRVAYRAEVDQATWYVSSDSWTFLQKHAAPRADKGGGHHHHGAYRGHALRFSFLGSKTDSISATGPGPTRYNYFLGPRKRWASKLRAHHRLTVHGLYPGISAALSHQGHSMKYSFLIDPGADPGQIKMLIEGAEHLEVAEDGKRLRIRTSLGTYEEHMPRVYQPGIEGAGDHGVRYGKSVSCRYALHGDTLHFVFPEGFDPRYRLIIDPQIVFSSLSGVGAGDNNWGFTAAYDRSGNGYAGGVLFHGNYRIPEPGAFQQAFAGGQGPRFIARDILIYKLNADGSQAEYMTYLGGSGNEQPHSMITNRKGQLFVMGYTGSADFPVAANGHDTSYNQGGDIFLCAFTADGSQLIAGTFLGGADLDGINYGSKGLVNGLLDPDDPPGALAYNYGDMFRGEIALDDEGQVYLASCTRSARIDQSVNQAGTYSGGGSDALVAHFSSDLSRMHFLRYLGGRGEDVAYSIVPTSDGKVYVAGGTSSSDFPIGARGLRRQYRGGMADGWLLRLGGGGQIIERGTFLGSSGNHYDQAYFVRTGPNGFPYVFGQTSGSYPVQAGTYQNANSGQFIEKLSYDLDRSLFATVVGAGSGRPELSPTAFMVDACGRIYISGWFGIKNHGYHPGAFPRERILGFPISSDAVQTETDGSDFYIAVYEPDMQALRYATYFGGQTQPTPPGIADEGDHVDGGSSRFSPDGIIYQSICGACNFDTYPTSPGAHGSYEQHRMGNSSSLCSNALLKLDLEGPDLQADFDYTLPACGAPLKVRFDNLSQGATAYQWDFGDGDTSTDKSPTHTYEQPGVYTVRLRVQNTASCNQADTLSRRLVLRGQPSARLAVQYGCDNDATLSYVSTAGDFFIWNYGDGNTVATEERTVNHSYQDSGAYLVSVISTDEDTMYCPDTLYRSVNIGPPRAAFVALGNECATTVRFDNQSRASFAYNWEFGDSSRSISPRPVHQYQDTGTYTVRLVINPNTPGCQDTVEKNVRIAGRPSNGIFVENDTCISGAHFEATNPAETEVLWRFGDGDTAMGVQAFHNYRDTGRFTTLMITRPGLSCADTQQTSVQIGLLQFAQFEILDLKPCEGRVLTRDLSRKMDSSQWYLNGRLISRQREPVLRIEEKGSYRLTLQGYLKRLCRDSFTQSFELPELPQSAFQRTPHPCVNGIAARALSTAGDSQIWKLNGMAVGNGPKLEWAVEQPGTYTLSLENASGDCAAISSQDVVIDELPEADLDFILRPCEREIILTDRSQGAFTRRWRTESGLEQGPVRNGDSLLYAYPHQSDFDVILTINTGTICADSVRIPVSLEEAQNPERRIPNVMTPNGDGRNDTWRVDLAAKHLAACGPFQLRIFNRWGQQLYEKTTQDPILEWDGTREGQAAPAGTYFYFLDLGHREVRGTITLVR